MKSIKSLVGTLLGGIGILAGFGMLVTGCSDDDKNTDTKAKITQAQLDECCNTADDYDACVKDYQKNGVCANDDIDTPTELYGPLPPTEYGPIYPDEPTPEDIAECCGDDDGSAYYKKCVEKLTQSGDCNFNDDVPTYGMPDTPPDEQPDA